MPNETAVTPNFDDEGKKVNLELVDGMKADAPTASVEPSKEDAKPEPPKEEPKLPLFMADSRFALLERTILGQFQNKFVKLFRKIKPGHSYKSNQEIAAWLASFVFQNLRCTHEAFKTGPEDLQVFMFVFKALISQSELAPKAKTAEEVKGALEDAKEAADPAVPAVATPIGEIAQPSTPVESEKQEEAEGQTS